MKRVNDELTITGLIFSGIILVGMYLNSQYKTNKEMNELQSNYFQAMSVAIELNEENQSLHNALISMNLAYDELEQDTIGLNKLIKIKESLRGYSIEEKAMGLALSWTESTWRFKVDHKSEAEGICGVVPRFWSDYLSSRGVDINSVSACIEIYNFYKEQHNGNRKEAIKAYKGIENNTYLIDRTLILRDRVLKILKDNK